MNENTDQPCFNPADQQEFLRVFLANEREILRYVVALVPNLADAQEIVQQTAVVLLEKFDQYDRSRPFAPMPLMRQGWLIACMESAPQSK